MDNLIDPFLSSQSWSDVNASSRTSWDGSSLHQPNRSIQTSVGTYKCEEKNPNICVIPSSHILHNISPQEANIRGNSGNYAINNGIIKHELQNMSPSQHASAENCSFSLQEVMDNNSPAASYVPEINASCSIPLSHGVGTDTSSISCNGDELAAFQQSLGESSSSSVSTVWPPKYSNINDLILAHAKVNGLGMHGVEGTDLQEACIGDHKFLQDSDEIHNQHAYSFLTGQQLRSVRSNGLLVHPQEQYEMHRNNLPSFASGTHISSTKSAGMTWQQSIDGSNQYTYATSATQSQNTLPNLAGCNGAAKPRVRARRGQATDPHSIAERLRREKIADRMKNLQELVPNTNKTDKASMLDEIIEYVKFLQLQVKVLSMSRLGACGAVVPLITENQSENCGGLHLSQLGHEVVEAYQSQDLAFEQEVVKLMESNVTRAMQFLQNKGLCLMPTALASAISNQKGQSAATMGREFKKSDSTYSNGTTIKDDEEASKLTWKPKNSSS